MQITLSSKEFDEAVSLWLKAQGFTTDRYSISTRCIAGRSDGPLGTRLEVQLDPKTGIPSGLIPRELLAAADGDVGSIPPSIRPNYGELLGSDVASDTIIPVTKRFGQGHADE